MIRICQSFSKEKRILKAAEKVFSRKGYMQATLDEIIQIADTGKGTVYKYYQNKENLFYTLVNGKNQKLLKKMEKILEDYPDFAHRFKEYTYALVDFLGKNGVLWGVVMFEQRAGRPGWYLRWDDAAKDYTVITVWGKRPTPEEVQVQRKYAEILRTEISYLRKILDDGIADGTLKPLSDAPAVAENLYFSLCMSATQGAINKENMAARVPEVLDRFLYGHKA